MADDAGVDAGDGGEAPIVSDEVTKGAPPDPAQDDEPVFVSAEELQARADAFEASLGIKKTAEEAADTDTTTEGEEPAAAPSQIEELLRQNRELLETIKSLTSAGAEGGAETEDPLATARAASPEIKQLDGAITSTEQDTNRITTQNNVLFEQLGIAQAEVLELTGALKHVDPEDKPEFRNQLNEAIAKRDRIAQQMDRNDERANRNTAQLSSLKLQKATVERELQRSVEEGKKQSESNEIAKAETRTTFQGTFVEEAREYGVDPKSPMYSRLFRDIKNELYLHTSALAANDPNAPGIDIAAATKHLFKQMADTYKFGRQQELGAASRAKVANRTAVARPGTRLPTPAAAAGPRRLTLEEVRSRRDAILSGGRA